MHMSWWTWAVMVWLGSGAGVAMLLAGVTLRARLHPRPAQDRESVRVS